MSATAAVLVCSSLDTSSPSYSFALVKSGFISSCFPFLFEKTGWGRAAEDGPHLREGVILEENPLAEVSGGREESYEIQPDTVFKGG